MPSMMGAQAWGQPQNTPEVTAFAAALDPGRLWSSASGWNNSLPQLAGDVVDTHDYSTAGPVPLTTNFTRGVYINMLGEMGGLGFVVPGVTLYNPAGTYYANRDLIFAEEEGWFAAYEERIDRMVAQVADPEYGLSAAVYTDLVDVAADVAGLATYDRRHIKINTTRLAAVNSRFINALQS